MQMGFGCYNTGGSFPDAFPRRKTCNSPDGRGLPLGGDPLTSQVMTSSDLLPPPPLTLAGVTSGTVQGTKWRSRQGQRQTRTMEAARLR